MKRAYFQASIWLFTSLAMMAQDHLGAPYPPSTFLKGVHFAPPATVIRIAKGGDNWPLSWAADGHLYTTYGDGYGFEPKVSEKLGLGFARVEGTPPYIKGINIRSEFENKGYGRNGKKGTGLLSIDNRLYIWLMHADEQGGQSQLAWTENDFEDVTLVDWKFSEFGICSFINFGKNNQGSRDRNVYIVSHDGPRADTPADHFVLMRVSESKIIRRGAYRFFAGLTKDGKPKWTRDMDRRAPVFSNTRHCLRSSISYNPGLQRYFWWQQIPNFEHPEKDLGDTRFEGGFGLYEAPEPWGPWKTAYFTKKWDMGPGELASFPVKWISQDGRKCYLVFSGQDAFSVRKVTFDIAE